MNGIAALAGTPVDQAAGLITLATAAAISVTILLHWFFDVSPAASATAGVHIQRRIANTGINRLATNQASFAHSTSPFRHTDLGGRNVAAASTGKPTMPAMSAALQRRWPR